MQLAIDPVRVSAYAGLMLLGIGVTAFLWDRIGRKGEHDARLTKIYVYGLLGAVLGAKLAFFFAEGWLYRDNALALLTGRSVTGALLGGYVAVELGKKAAGYPRTTGDAFAILAPIGLGLGRVGCLIQGCCRGIECSPAWWTLSDAAGSARWPAAAAELGFNLLFLAWVLAAQRFGWQKENRFHVYLIGYGLFRFGHEFLRQRQELVGLISGYQIVALLILALGLWRYVERRRAVAAASV